MRLSSRIENNKCFKVGKAKNMVSVIPFEKVDKFVNKQFIVDHANPAGLVRVAGVNNVIPVQGESWQTLDFSGDFALFNDIENQNASDDENKKTQVNTATNNKITFMPLTQYYGIRVPRRFLEITTGDGYGRRWGTGQYLNANSAPQAWASVKNNPDFMPYLDALQNNINEGIGRAIDYEAIFGLNPKTRKKSGLIGDNYILNNADGSLNNRLQKWTAPSKVGTVGDSSASDVFQDAVQWLGEHDNVGVALQGVETFGFNNYMKRERLQGGLPGYYSNQLPLMGASATVEGVQLAITPTLADTAAATAAGVPAGTVIDAIIGNIQRRFRWGFEILGDGIEVFDTGNPDGGATDLAVSNEVYLRVEARLGWGMIGGYDKLRVIAHTAPTGVSAQDDEETAAKTAKSSK
jgi:hypothetical protein